jgi:hypothetical protein
MNNLQNELVKMFKEDLKAVFKKEAKEKDYLPQEDFACCYDRAEAGIDAATIRVKNALALAIAKHREDEHEENTLNEQASLMSDMGSHEVEVSTLGFWKN